MASKRLSDLVDWILISVAAILLVIVFVTNATSYGADEPFWYFGEGLEEGDVFEYKICDFVQSEVQEKCYVVGLEFVRLLPDVRGNVWVVSSQIFQGEQRHNMVFLIDNDSFAIRTDGVSAKYADSVKRTLGWIQNNANAFNQKSLRVGTSWGEMSSGQSMMTTLVVNSIIESDTYLIGYSQESSYVIIKDGFPFPTKAIVYKPSIYVDTPLEFTVDLVSYHHSNLCDISGIIKGMNYTSVENENDSNVFDRVSSSKEIQQMRNIATSEKNGTLIMGDIQDGEKIGELFGNLTDFLKSITDMTQKIIQNQTSR